jgi:glycine betaine/choline ABC-type transport system substrate-binding protein/ABC-type proline/glycine betaine transport system permease subunit
MREQLALLPEYLTDHLQLTLLALLLGSLLSVPLGIWSTRRRRLGAGILAVAGVIQTIPSLALLAVMVPFLAWLGALASGTGIEIRSIGFLPAIVGLTLYSILPILQNTIVGINGVDPALREAARGVGMTDRQQLWRVELPLAMPVIVGGIRTSTVWVVGIATLSTPVGASSLGNYIFSGLQTRNFNAVLVGCASAAGLAIGLDSLVRALETGIRRRRPRLTAAAAGILGALMLYAAASFATGAAQRDRPILIGAKTFTEQYVLGEILATHVQRETGRSAKVVPSLGSTVAFDALRANDIDAYVDYSGTIWATIMKRTGVPPDRVEVLEEVGQYLKREHGITLVGALGFENAYALAMRAERARQLGVDSLSKLTPHTGSLEIAGDYEFFGRPEWAALERVYGFAFRARRSMDPTLMYQAVAESQVDVISAFTTDGRIAAYHLAILQDDRHAIPPYDAIILAGPRLARERPEVLAALRDLSGSIQAEEMRRMNSAVDREGRSPGEVARDFLGRRP